MEMTTADLIKQLIERIEQLAVRITLLGLQNDLLRSEIKKLKGE